ncbi:MAG: phospholipase A [Pseudomonadota bacterium]
MIIRKPFLFVAAMLLAAGVYAADPGERMPGTASDGTTEGPVAAGLAACAAVPSVDTRLACYDELSIKQGLHVGGSATGVEDPADDGVVSRIVQRWDLEDISQRGRFALLVHRPNYLMPATWNFRPNQQPFPVDSLRVNNQEAKLQLSIKVKIWEDLFGSNGDLWATYTQQSFWQVYNKSSPFRDTSYEPSLLFALRTDYNVLGMRGRLLGVEFNHESNGRGDPQGLSRSWNRIIGKAVFERGPFVMETRAWWRIPEPSSDDNNPDIQDYLGNGDLLLSWAKGGHTVSAQLRGKLSFDKPRGGAELSWSFPVHGADNLHGYLQYYQGYGESLIDYNAKSQRIGLGFAFSDWY